MKGLSWKEPYGTLMLHGKIETRTWKTDCRGPVLICCSQRAYNGTELMEISGPTLIEKMRPLLPNGYTLGHAIAVGDLVNCRLMEEEDEERCFVKYEDLTFVPKNIWCHVYENVRAIEPIPVKGKQRWWTVPQNIIDQIRYK